MERTKKNLKVYLLGAGGTGKTAFTWHHTTGMVPKAYISTMGCQIDTMSMENGYTLNLVEPGKDEQLYGQFDGRMWSNTQIDNSMYDNTYALAFYEPDETVCSLTNHIVKEFRKKCEQLSQPHPQSIKVISVWNKSDLWDTGDDVNFLRQGNESACKISLINNENCMGPLYEIMRMEESSSI
jgi:GTPase SAR1 family protein